MVPLFVLFGFFDQFTLELLQHFEVLLSLGQLVSSINWFVLDLLTLLIWVIFFFDCLSFRFHSTLVFKKVGLKGFQNLLSLFNILHLLFHDLLDNFLMVLCTWIVWLTSQWDNHSLNLGSCLLNEVFELAIISALGCLCWSSTPDVIKNVLFNLLDSLSLFRECSLVLYFSN